MNFSTFIELVRAGDLVAVRKAVTENSYLVHISDPNHKDDEKTALHCAARYGHLDIVKFLVESGAEVYSNPMNSYPAVFWAANNRHFSDRPDTQNVVDYFLKEIPEKAAGTNGLGIAMNLAARLGYTEIVKKHIEKDPHSIHQRGWIGDTPLHWSSHNGHLDIVKILVDAGADIEADEINCYGGKPLHWASERMTEVVRYLLAQNAEVDSRNELDDSTYFGITPLGMNVLMEDDCAEVTQVLIDAGADTSVKFKGETLLEIAQRIGNERIEEVLSRHLAN